MTSFWIYVCFRAPHSPRVLLSIHQLLPISAIMLVAALIILNKELLTGMSLGDTANLGIVSLVFAFLATVAYAVAAAFIIKRALSTASRTAPEREQTKSKTESKDEKNGTKTENAATP